MAVNILTEQHWFSFINHPLCCGCQETAPGNVLWCSSRLRDTAWWVLFSTQSCKEKDETQQHLLTCTSVVAQGRVINQVKWESWFIMFSSPSKLFLAPATVCCHLSSADKTLYWVIIATGSLTAICFSGRMGAAHNYRVSRYRRQNSETASVTKSLRWKRPLRSPESNC